MSIYKQINKHIITKFILQQDIKTLNINTIKVFIRIESLT